MSRKNLSAPLSPENAPRGTVSRAAWLLRLCGLLAICILTPPDMFFEGGGTHAHEPVLSSGYPGGDARAGAPDPELMEAVPAERLLPFWRQYTARFAPGEARFVPAYRLDSELAVETQSAGLWLEVAPGELYPIGLDARGYLVLPAIAAEAGIVHRQSRILIDPALRPPVVRLEIHPRLPLTQRYEIAELSGIAAEVEQFQRHSMGLMFLASPRWTELVFRFDNPPPDGWLVRANGTRTALSAFEDRLSIRLDGRTMRAGGHVELERAPVQIILQAR